MARVALPESRLRARRRKQRILVGWFAVAGVIVVVGGLIALTWAPFLRVTGVDVSGSGAVPVAAISEVALHDLSGTYLHIFPHADILMYPKQAIEGDLLARFPTLKTVDVHAENFHTVAVAVTEQVPAALWCGSVVASTSVCSFMNADGLVYAPTDGAGEGSFQKYYGDLSTSTMPAQYLTPDSMHALSALVATLGQKLNDTPVVATWVDENADVHLTFASGFTLLFADAQSGGELMDRLNLVLGAAPFSSHKVGDFEYLDVRFGDKIYYKLKTK